MARTRRISDKANTAPAGGPGYPPPLPPPAPPGQPEPPVGILMAFRDGAEAEGLEHAQKALGQQEVVRYGGEDGRSGPAARPPAGGLAVLSQFGLAFTQAGPNQVQQLRSSAAPDGPLESVLTTDVTLIDRQSDIPATAEAPPNPQFLDYLLGYRDAVNNLAGAFGITPDGRAAAALNGPVPAYRDDEFGTWGLHATGVLSSRFTGRGVRVAALVDGLATGHSDWVGRPVVMKSFVPGEDPSVGGGTGTHYLGTAFGTTRPSSGPRYGCAPDALPYVAKVLSRTGTGSLVAVLAALDWAVANGCRVILIPLGYGGPLPDSTVELLAARAASRGAILVAGVGNNARRSTGNYGFVVNPAACPSVMGVGAVDARLQLPDWSPRSSAPPGGVVDLVAPGVSLRSSVPPPQLYTAWSGSATAAAYTAGIAALWAEAMPRAGASELWQALISHARPLPLLTADIGAGLVQAP